MEVCIAGFGWVVVLITETWCRVGVDSECGSTVR